MINDKNRSFGAESTLYRVLTKLCALFNFIFMNYEKNTIYTPKNYTYLQQTFSVKYINIHKYCIKSRSAAAGCQNLYKICGNENGKRANVFLVRKNREFDE